MCKRLVDEKPIIKHAAFHMRLHRIVFSLWIGLTMAAAVESTNVTARLVTLQGCVDMAIEHNLDVQIQRIYPEMVRYSLSASYGAYDPTFSLSGKHSYRLLPKAGGLDHPDSSTDSFEMGFSGLLPSGLAYGLSGDLSQSYGLNTFPKLGIVDGFENSSGTASLFFLKQPLLKNFWIDGARKAIWANKKNLQMSELDLQSLIMSIITEVEVAYYGLILAGENVKVQGKALELSMKLLAENKKRVEVGAMAPLDEKDAASQVAANRANLLSEKNNLAIKQTVLKRLLKENFTDWHQIPLEPTEPLRAVPQAFSLQDSWHKGLSLRPDFQKYRLELALQDIEIRYSRNQLFPELDLEGTYGHLGQGREYSGAWSQIRDGENPFYSFGATLRFPLSNRGARAQYKTSKAQKEQLVLRMKKAEQQILTSIDNAVKSAQSSYEQVDATKQAREFAEAAMDAEQKKLENGKSTSFIVLRLQSILTQQRSAEIRALANYNMALALLAAEEGYTLQRHNLQLGVK